MSPRRLHVGRGFALAASLGLLCACQGLPPLPLEPAALQGELSRRFESLRQAAPGFEARGSVDATDAEGARSSTDWRLTVLRDRFVEFALESGLAGRPVLVLQAVRGRPAAVWLQPPGRGEPTTYQAARAAQGADAAASDPRVRPLLPLLRALEDLAAGHPLQIERVEPGPDGSELLASARPGPIGLQLRLRRADAFPLLITAAAEGPQPPACLEIRPSDKSWVDATGPDTGLQGAALRWPAELLLRLSSCCDPSAALGMRIRLRSLALGVPTPTELPAGRVLPIDELPRDRAWQGLQRGLERGPSRLACPPR